MARQVSFAGRHKELAQIESLIRALPDNRCASLCFVGGSKGIGKTSFLFEIDKIAKSHDCSCYYGSCKKGDGLHPLGALEDILVRILRGYSESNKVQELFYSRGLTLPGSACDSNSLAYSGLTDDDDDLYAILTGEGQLRRRHSLFDSICSLLSSIGNDKPLILLFDDMEMGDKFLWTLLSQLIYDIASKPVILICSGNETVNFSLEQHMLQEAALSSAIDSTEIALKALDEKDIRSILGSVYPDNTFSEALVLELVQASAGVPSLLYENLTTLEVSGVISLNEGHWANVEGYRSLLGEELESIVFRRLASMSESDIDLIEFLAGFPELLPLSLFGSQKILSYIGLNERSILKKICRFSDKSRLFSLKEGSCILRFPFLGKESGFDDSSRLSKRDNEVVAEGLEEIAGSNISPLTGTIANLYLAGENYEKAAVHLRNGAKYLNSFGALSGAIKVLVQEIEVLPKIPQHHETSRQIANSYLDLARNYQLEGKWRKAVLNCEAAIPFLATCDDGIKTIRAELSIALNLISLQKYADAEQSLTVLSLSELVPLDEKIVASLLLSDVFLLTARPEKALAVLKQSTASLDNADNLNYSLVARLLLATGNYWFGRRELLKADRMYTKGIEVATSGSTTHVDLLCCRARVALASAALKPAEGLLDEAMELSAKLSYLKGKATASELMADLKQESDPLKAIEHLLDTYFLLVRLDLPIRLSTVCRRLGIIYRSQNDLKRSHLFLEMAYNMHVDGKASSDSFLQTALALGELVLSENKLYEAQTIFTKACESSLSEGNTKAGAFAAFGLGKVFLAQRKSEKAREQFEVARTFFAENNMADRLSMVEKELRLTSL